MPKLSFAPGGAQGDFKSLDDLKKKVPGLDSAKVEGRRIASCSRTVVGSSVTLTELVFDHEFGQRHQIYLNPNGFGVLPSMSIQTLFV